MQHEQALMSETLNPKGKQQQASSDTNSFSFYKFGCNISSSLKPLLHQFIHFFLHADTQYLDTKESSAFSVTDDDVALCQRWNVGFFLYIAKKLVHTSPTLLPHSFVGIFEGTIWSINCTLRIRYVKEVTEGK